MMSDLILLQLLLPARDADERGLWCVLSTSTASHRAAVYDGQTEPPLRRRALPDGRLLRFRRDPNASHHLSGKPTREQRHVQVREGPDRPEVGRSSGGRTSERCCAMSCGTVRLIALFPGSLSPPEQTLCLIPQKKPHLSPSSVLSRSARGLLWALKYALQCFNLTRSHLCRWPPDVGLECMQHVFPLHQVRTVLPGPPCWIFVRPAHNA